MKMNSFNYLLLFYTNANSWRKSAFMFKMEVKSNKNVNYGLIDT